MEDKWFSFQCNKKKKTVNLQPTCVCGLTWVLLLRPCHSKKGLSQRATLSSHLPGYSSEHLILVPLPPFNPSFSLLDLLLTDEGPAHCHSWRCFSQDMCLQPLWCHGLYSISSYFQILVYPVQAHGSFLEPLVFSSWLALWELRCGSDSLLCVPYTCALDPRLWVGRQVSG